MNDEEIKKIARLTLRKGKINGEIARFVLKRFSKKHLFKYLSYLKNTAFENSIRIISSEKLSPLFKREIERKFAGKSVFYEVDNTLGDGIKAIIGDTIIDLSLKKYIDNITKGLKN